MWLLYTDPKIASLSANWQRTPYESISRGFVATTQKTSFTSCVFQTASNIYNCGHQLFMSETPMHHTLTKQPVVEVVRVSVGKVFAEPQQHHRLGVSKPNQLDKFCWSLNCRTYPRYPTIKFKELSCACHVFSAVSFLQITKSVQPGPVPNPDPAGKS